MKLTAFDQVMIYDGSGPAGAAREAVELAVAAERLGYHRFWVAEHHGVSGGCGSPEVLVAAAASATGRIRVGTASVLLPYYAPLKVATTFNLLERLFPGRIDLGVGRGPGAVPAVSRRLAREGEAPYEEKLAELLRILTSEGPEHSLPESGRPDFWLTGSGTGGALAAARHGLPFCFAQFVHGELRPEVVERYREEFRPGPFGSEPRVGVCVRTAVAEDPRDARALRSLVDWIADAGRGAALPAGVLPSWRELREYRPAVASPDGFAVLAGVPEEVGGKVSELVDAYRPDELVVTTACPELALRVRVFELVGQMMKRQLASEGGLVSLDPVGTAGI
ncbi:MsnO8 family LLM class oxidoreductase [Kitasatospora sp. NPDC059577]|uniref:MsnO8 family LLM class oxidoreductase n=1 Tax=Kitasatospora sp. NPDC059577 TaxID=3346873 RepID=UPI0036A3572B